MPGNGDGASLTNADEACGGATGGAVMSDGNTGADDLINGADQAMYRAKQHHRADAAA
jgi:PleD family two-component response regulator